MYLYLKRTFLKQCFYLESYELSQVMCKKNILILEGITIDTFKIVLQYHCALTLFYSFLIPQVKTLLETINCEKPKCRTPGNILHKKSQ